RRGGRHRAGLADARRRSALVALNENLDALWRVAERRDRIGVPSGVDDAALAMKELLLQGPRRGLLDTAFDLIAHALGVQGLARVDDAPYLHEAHGTRERDLDLRDLRYVRPVID